MATFLRVRRFVLGLILALLPAVAPAADAPGAAAGAPAMRELPVAPDSFVRGAPLPAWVQRPALPPTSRGEPVVIRLRDAQVRLGESTVVFVDTALQVHQSAALGHIGQFVLAYVPQYQRLNLHEVTLLRGDTVLDRTAAVDVRFLERETGFERGVYSGALTVALVIPDVRVGDTLRVAWFVEGHNPVFGGRYFEDFGWDADLPTEWRRVTLTAPEGRTLHWRMLGDYRRGGVEPRVERAGGLHTLRFEERAIEPLPLEPLVPSDYFMWRMLQVSEFADWNEVARWAGSLFPPVADLPAEMQALLATLSQRPTAAARVAAALRWVQGEIRYFSLSIGESSHRPHDPALVVQRRYGDCKDKSYLLLTLLRRLGVEATPVLLALRGPRAPLKVLPSPWPFDHVVIRAVVDGRTVYLDPATPVQTADLFAIGQPAPWSQGLVASAATKAPAALDDAFNRQPETIDVEERFTFETLGPEARLEVRHLAGQSTAELLRFAWPLMPPETRRQAVLAPYEKIHPGAELVGDPQPVDDLERNRFGYVATLRIPRLAEPFQGGWAMRYGPTALAGALQFPPSLQRRFPLRATFFPMERRHVVTVQWPPQVSALEDPQTSSMDGKLFRAEARTSFRGARYESVLTLSTKAPDLEAGDLQALMADLKRLEAIVPGRVVVGRQMIGPAPSPGSASAADAMRREMQQRIELAGGAIRSGLNQGDDLAAAHCRRADALAKLERFAEAQTDADEAVRLAPRLAVVWGCRGEVLYRRGDFAGADAALTRALELDSSGGLGPHYVRGMARFYLGRLADAAADFTRAAQAEPDGDARLYPRLWQVWALQRAGLPLPADALAAARQDPRGAWPRPALALLVGDLTPQALLEEVDRLQGDERTLTLAEAWFYVGQVHLVQGRVDDARKAFENCRAQGITSDFEHVAAGFELARLGAR